MDSIKRPREQREVLHNYLLKKKKNQEMMTLIKWVSISLMFLLTISLSGVVLMNERVLESLQPRVHETK
jgi:hypothetical protein